MRGSSLLIVICLLSACAAPAFAEGVVIRIPGMFEPAAGPSELPAGLEPGRAVGKDAVAPCAWRFAWDNYVSVIVVCDGTGVARPAWVLTFDQEGKYVVGYRARAFRSADGLVHIDARNAIDAGPLKDEWSPDSFSFGPGDEVYSLDDQNRGHAGEVQLRLDGGHADYQGLLSLAQALIRGAI